jgi:uncharacterized protein
LIDDKKARLIAEMEEIKCIGTLGVLFFGKQKGLIESPKSEFQTLLSNKRYYSKNLLNHFLRNLVKK